MVRAGEVVQGRRVVDADFAGAYIAGDPDWKPKKPPEREVTGWSAKSRANMVKRIAFLDWGPVRELEQRCGRFLAQVTFTYPADWLAVVPDGRTLKRQFRDYRKRYRRAWGEPYRAAWKLEFQDRGAPHIHVATPPPHGVARGRGVGAGLTFRQWHALNWVDIVDPTDKDGGRLLPPEERRKMLAVALHPDTISYADGLKCTDPKRLAMYFAKHGVWASKEYQHVVPEPWREPGKGPGRFWGYCGLEPAAVAVDVTWDEFKLIARTMRRLSERVRVWDKVAGKHVYVRAMSSGKVSYRDVDRDTGEVIWRRHRRRSRVSRCRSGAGFLTLNDAPAVAHQLARLLETCGDR